MMATPRDFRFFLLETHPGSSAVVFLREQVNYKLDIVSEELRGLADPYIEGFVVGLQRAVVMGHCFKNKLVWWFLILSRIKKIFFFGNF